MPDSNDSVLLKIGNRELKISNPDKLFWPEDKITKLDLVNYYIDICQYILPFVKDRPQTLHRYPDGYSGKSFYQKDVGKLKLPEWIKTKKIKSTSSKKTTEYLICDSCESLIFMVNLGCIEIHPWISRVGSLNYPDWIVFDLDIQETEFENVIIVAKGLNDLLKKHGIKSFCKTSGANGLHIYIQNKNNLKYKEAKDFAFNYAKMLNSKFPDLTSLVRNPALREKKIYIDYLQNSRGKTMAAPYSVRPFKGAPVSIPLSWNEISTNFNKDSFNLKTVPKRLQKSGEIWSDFLF